MRPYTRASGPLQGKLLSAAPAHPVRRCCVRGTLPAMTQSQQQSSDQSTGTADRPATTQQGVKRSSRPETFGDGSTREQQDRLIREAKEANEQVKELADAERKAREA